MLNSRISIFPRKYWVVGESGLSSLLFGGEYEFLVEQPRGSSLRMVSRDRIHHYVFSDGALVFELSSNGVAKYHGNRLVTTGFFQKGMLLPTGQIIHKSIFSGTIKVGDALAANISVSGGVGSWIKALLGKEVAADELETACSIDYDDSILEPELAISMLLFYGWVWTDF